MRTRRRVIENMEESTSEQGEKYLRTRKRGRGRKLTANSLPYISSSKDASLPNADTSMMVVQDVTAFSVVLRRPKPSGRTRAQKTKNVHVNQAINCRRPIKESS